MNNLDYDRVLDELIDENTEPTLDEVLLERGLTFEKAMDLAEKDVFEHLKLAKNIGISHLEKPMIWCEIIKLCKDNLTDEKLDLLVWLMNGGEFVKREELADIDEKKGFVGRWLYCDEQCKLMSEQISERKQKNKEFDDILRQIKHKSTTKPNKCSNDYEKVGNMLFEEGYVSKETGAILMNNLCCIEACIAENPCLNAIKPLVYYQAYVSKRKKLMEKADYTPCFKNLFNPVQYKIHNDNGKNFDCYELYSRLYLDLLDCFPECDIPLCNAGFVKCSNLAEWCYFNVDSGGRIPLDSYGMVAEAMPLLFDNQFEDIDLFGQFNLNYDLLEQWREKYSGIARIAEKTVQELTFDDLPELIGDSKRFFARFYNEAFLEKVKVKYAEQARGLLLKEIVSQISFLFYEELAGILEAVLI